jgi:hemoglobin
VPETLFNKYGGYATLTGVVRDYYAKARDSEVLGPYFDGADMPGLVKHQTEFLGSLMGGPRGYANQELQRIHRHFDITDTAFSTMMKLMRESLEHAYFEDADIEEIMDRMRRRRRYIVTPGRL